ncbi:aldehyde dehydrogenase family protein [Gynuella sunshinyii]|uniref:NAD-dependent aldehyde dehydrogenase n=1 Tax=Gynuella sunshinyii YC6258 TaxID=1445510 RepID=A0A0C5VSM0_9GAMM|nr:aldehyde dehydrogenase family protein [Gynuella sunshinyii]AJQ97682.1 NAD-dependent aldehyde dehydrogenase [Gynuella sunshinyii YC6258]
MKHYNLTINGETKDHHDYFDVINPATAEPFARSAKADAADVNRAVAAASNAFASWSTTPMAERSNLLHQVAALVEQHMPELMELIVQETGKPLNGLNGVGAGMEVGGAAAWIHVNADVTLPVEVIQDNDDARVEVHRKALGVVASITPWNWPLLIAAWHLTPALLAGNTVVIKPSPFTPITTARFVELANTVLPPGVLNLISGGPELGATLVEHPDVAKIVFTGSTTTGKHIMRSAATDLKRLTLELGGNDAGIVLDDVDPKAVAARLVSACFHNNGQTCAALKRLYVPSGIYHQLAQEMADLAAKLIVGNGLAQGVDLGPVQNERQLQIVMDLAESARQDGGHFLCGGERIDSKGYFYRPTIVTGLSNGHRLVDEEPFGPIVPIIEYQDLEQAIAMANDNPCGLGASVWSTDTARALAVATRLHSGSVWINEHGAVQPDAPFGGVKQSGFGVEFGHHGLAEFSAIQTVKIMK